jgi:hypothetical protein
MPEAPTQAYPDDLDARLDHIVDTEGLSYFDARAKLGVPEPEADVAAVQEVVVTEAQVAVRAPAAVSSAARSRRARAAMGPQYGEEAGVGYPGGLPPEHQPRVILSDDQVARNQRGMALVRATLAAKNNRTQ